MSSIKLDKLHKICYYTQMSHPSFSHEDYFPDEAFDPEIVEPDEPTHGLKYYKFVDALRQASREAIGHEGFLTKEEESDLAAIIQDGLKAKELADKMIADGNYDGRYDVDISKGREAKTRLVSANLPFAAACARWSMGETPSKPKTKTIATISTIEGDYWGSLRTPGTYSKLGSLANVEANLEDRTQIAIEAMWRAADKYSSLTEKSARFTTYAAWYIQSALHANRSAENSGWSASPDLYERYAQEIKEAKTYGRPARRLNHRSDEGLHQGYYPEHMMAGLKGIPYEGALGPGTDLSDIADIAASKDESPEAALDEAELRLAIIKLLSNLDDRVAEMVIMRYGLDGQEPQTIDEVARHHGISRERVRQLLSKAGSAMRHPSNSDELRQDFNRGILEGEWLVPPSLPNLVNGATNIRTGRMVAHANPKPLQKTRDPALEPWQVYPDEPWDLPEQRTVEV